MLAAYLALGVAVINIAVAAAAAAAVFWLGRQANALAIGTHRQAMTDRERADLKAIAKQHREEGVVLCYLAAEISAANTTIRVMNMLMETEYMNESGFVSSETSRASLLKKANEVQIPLMEEWVPRLHEISADTGMRLARFAGDVRSLKLHLATLARPGRFGENPSEEQSDSQTRDDYFKAGYGVVKLLAERASKDIFTLHERSFLAGVTLDSRLGSLA